MNEDHLNIYRRDRIEELDAWLSYSKRDFQYIVIIGSTLKLNLQLFLKHSYKNVLIYNHSDLPSDLFNQNYIIITDNYKQNRSILLRLQEQSKFQPAIIFLFQKSLAKNVNDVDSLWNIFCDYSVCSNLLLDNEHIVCLPNKKESEGHVYVEKIFLYFLINHRSYIHDLKQYDTKSLINPKLQISLSEMVGTSSVVFLDEKGENQAVYNHEGNTKKTKLVHQFPNNKVDSNFKIVFRKGHDDCVASFLKIDNIQILNAPFRYIQNNIQNCKKCIETKSIKKFLKIRSLRTNENITALNLDLGNDPWQYKYFLDINLAHLYQVHGERSSRKKPMYIEFSLTPWSQAFVLTMEPFQGENIFSNRKNNFRGWLKEQIDGICEIVLDVKYEAIDIYAFDEDMNVPKGRTYLVEPGPNKKVKFRFSNLSKLNVVFRSVASPKKRASVSVKRTAFYIRAERFFAQKSGIYNNYATEFTLFKNNENANKISIIPKSVSDMGKMLGTTRKFVDNTKIVSKPWTEWNIEGLDSKILKFITKSLQPKTVFEFGTLSGRRTSLFLENGAEHVTTINLEEGELKKDGSFVYSFDGKTQADIGDNIGADYRAAGLSNRVSQLFGDSKTSLDHIENDSYDFVFVDGGHDTKTVKLDTMNGIRILRSGGIIVWHDFVPIENCVNQETASFGVINGLLECSDLLNSEMEWLHWIRSSLLLVGKKL